MASKGQMTGMRGVYLVASELCRLGFIASPTSRSAAGADILATDQECCHSFSIQVKTNARTFNFWLLNKKSRTLVSDTLVYVLANIRQKKGEEQIEYFVVPSKIVSKRMKSAVQGSSQTGWHSIAYSEIEEYRDGWDIFSK